MNFDKAETITLFQEVISTKANIPNSTERRRTTTNKTRHNIEDICESRPQLTVYDAKIYSNIGLHITPEYINRDRMNYFKRYCEVVQAHKEPYAIDYVANKFGIMKVIDDLLTYLS